VLRRPRRWQRSRRLAFVGLILSMAATERTAVRDGGLCRALVVVDPIARISGDHQSAAGAGQDCCWCCHRRWSQSRCLPDDPQGRPSATTAIRQLPARRVCHYPAIPFNSMVDGLSGRNRVNGSAGGVQNGGSLVKYGERALERPPGANPWFLARTPEAWHHTTVMPAAARPRSKRACRPRQPCLRGGLDRSGAGVRQESTSSWPTW